MNRKSLPANPSLEFDKKQAKKLLDEAKQGERAALSRLRTHHPRFSLLADAGSVGLHDAQLVVAREYGFASWPRWKEFVLSRRLDVGERAAELVRAACSGDMRKAVTLLVAEPTLASFDLFSACACGDSETVERLVARDPAAAKRKGGPNDWEPILYACFSRFLRADLTRGAGIVRSVRMLLERGANPSSHFFVVEHERPSAVKEIQTCLYGAAGIANSAELTRLLLDSGATAHEDDNEVVYHSSEFKDVTCLRLVLETKPPAKAVSYCLGRALDFDNEAAALLFLEYGADPNHCVSTGRTHMHKAAINGRSVATVTAMLEHGGDFRRPDPHGVSPYRYAVKFGHEHLVKLFESRGAEPAAATAADRALGQASSGSGGPTQVDRDSATSVLTQAAQRGNVAALVRLLEAGADVDGLAAAPAQHDAPAGEEQNRMPPLHSACWSGRLEAAKLLVERGASLTILNTFGGDALGTAIHGSANCLDPEGGIGMRLPEEITHGNYPEIVELLIRSGSKLPDRIGGGSEAVQEVLRGHGVPDSE